MKVFLSVGRTFTPKQKAFVEALEKYLRANGLDPQTVGRTVIKNQRPLKSSADCIHQCVGTIIVAFERLFVADGVEKRDSDDSTPLSGVKITTVWNQIEAAMAYGCGHPILVLAEKGTRQDGLLEKGYDWYVKSMNLEPSELSDDEFIGLIADWKSQLEHRRPSAQVATVDPSQLTVAQLLGALRPAQLWTALGALATLIVAVATFAYKVGAATAR